MRKRNKIVKVWPGELTMEKEMEVLFSEDQKNLFDRPEGEMSIDYSVMVESTDIDTGSIAELLVLCESNGTLWATISPTLIDKFVTIQDFLTSHGKILDTIKLYKRKSDRGREFLLCDMVAYHSAEVEP